MNTRQRAAVLTAVVCVAVFCAHANAQAPSSDLRTNATVMAVRKAKPSVVAIKVQTSSTKGPNGSGVIIDERGYIITNRHVVGSASEVQVRFADDTELPGTILVTDGNTDLAVVKVDAKKALPALALARTDDVEVGEDVIAIGHPYGYSFTVSKGIVSALGRKIELPTGAVLQGLIQTDASINPGNSGGPLLNINGEFIGVNTALRDGAQGIAFAINADTVRRVLSQKCSALKVAGVSHGLKVAEKVASGPAHRQQVVVAGLTQPSVAPGLKDGDVIRHIGTVIVASSFDVERAFWDTKPGQQVLVGITRNGLEITVTLTLPPPAGGASYTAVVATPRSR
jgi:serine protease Do